MSTEERIERLEDVVGTLIAWLHRELGTQAATRLLSRLEQDAPFVPTTPTGD